MEDQQMTRTDLQKMIQEALNAPFKDEDELYQTLAKLLQEPLDKEDGVA